MRISTLGYALLALLAQESLSGYDLARRMKRPLGFFWQAQHSQIYPELAQLQKQGHISHRLVVQEGRPYKKLYTITEAGRTLLKTWIVQPPSPPQERNELLLKTYAIWLVDRSEALALFRAQEQVHIEQLALYEQIQANIEAVGGEPHPGEPRFGDYATVRIGVAYERAYMIWCRWMVEQLERAQEGQHPTRE